MIASPKQSTENVNDGEVLSFVSRALASHPAGREQLVSLNRELYDYHSSFAIEELVAEFEDGDRLALLFKNLSPQGLLPGARQTRPHFYYDPKREIAVYREILALANLGTATCYGTVSDPKQQRYWLLLEKVSGDELYTIGDIDVWCDVARWLARMHDRLGKCAMQRPLQAKLRTYDADFYEVWIDRAQQFHGGRGGAGSPVSSAQMGLLIDRCRLATRHLCSQPCTFIHGEFYASNVLIDQRQHPRRICVVDWETAAIGPGLIDLAALVAGGWTESQKDQLAQAYFDDLPVAGRCWNSIQEMTRSLQCCRLFQAIRWLGWSPDWQPPPDHRSDWLTEAIKMAELMNDQG
jgi:Ser/Thr protein kinase RdoA (MazF antagonist)